MDINKKRGFRYVLVIVAFAFSISQQASAGLISVVADVNASNSNNFSFYDAILGSSQDVVFSRVFHNKVQFLVITIVYQG